MIRDLSIFIVAGARPNFMKVAPIIHALETRRASAKKSGINLRITIIHTGQHYDKNMSEVFFRELGIPPPDRHLEVGSGSHAEQTAKIMVAFEKVLLEELPEWIVVVGDVNSTMACSLTAKKLGVKVAHVEAGLRSFDLGMPEEINRKMTDAISDLLFVTEESGLKNLRTEGIPEDKIFFVGNVMIDTLLRNLLWIDGNDFIPCQVVRNRLETGKPYAVLTLHRPSNVDKKENLEPIWEAIKKISQRLPILFPVHPRTKNRIENLGQSNSDVIMTEPMGYHDMLFAVKRSMFVITDSGGLQEETTALGIPCMTIRENTERPITVDIGTNYLVGISPKAILETAEEILSGRSKKGLIPPLWDGRAAERIADILLRQ